MTLFFTLFFLCLPVNEVSDSDVDLIIVLRL